MVVGSIPLEKVIGLAPATRYLSRLVAATPFRCGVHDRVDRAWPSMRRDRMSWPRSKHQGHPFQLRHLPRDPYSALHEIGPNLHQNLVNTLVHQVDGSPTDRP